MSLKKGALVTLTVGIFISFTINASGYFYPRPSAIVQTENGKVRGYIAKSRDGRDYSAYVG